MFASRMRADLFHLLAPLNTCMYFLGMLLRLFMYMYDLEVIEEEAYLRWKEEVNDEYPGKGKSLFQVGSCVHIFHTLRKEAVVT